MCAPCKVIINEKASQAAASLNTLRELILAGEKPGEDNDMLFRMAKREVDFIAAQKRSAVEYAESIDAPPRWVELMGKL